VSFGKLIDVQSVTSAYQKTAGLKKLANKNLKNLYNLHSTRNITPHKISPNKLSDHQFLLTFSIYLPPYNCTVQTVDIVNPPVIIGARGSVVAKALRYKPAGRGLDSRWCHIFQ
jgi:hypothetical protein